MTNVALLFPTGTDPRSPYLALPCLAAHLRGAGIETNLFDLDITGLHALLESAHLEQAGARVRATAVRDTPDWRLARLSETLPFRAFEALAALRDKVRFYDPNQFNTARQTVYDALDLVSAAAPDPVHYGISPIRYDVDGVDTQRLGDLIRATASDRANLFAEYWERDIFPELKRQAPLYAGIAINNRQQILPGLLLARRLRERGYFVVLGGALFTKFVTQLQSLPAFFEYFADAIIAYEGETALVQLTDALLSSKSLATVPNLLYLENGTVRATTTHVEDVSKLPSPDFTGMPLSKYLSPDPVLPVYFGKGCYFNRCKFCDIPYINHISNKAYRLRTLDQIVAGFVDLKERFGCRHFEITDEALPPRFLEHLAEALEPHQSEGFCFVGYARLERGFTPDVCRKLARMGLKKIFFGLESGSQATLDHMDKGIRVSDVPGVLKNCRDAGILFHIFSIIGFPQEPESSARETYAFFERNADVLDHPGNSFDIHPFGLELRTAYFAQAESMGAFISPKALAKEFTIGAGTDWFNTFGLTHAEVAKLCAEFNAGLKERFHRYHAGPEHLWPGFEEYSVLYADHYATRDFLYRTSLPRTEELSGYTLRWSPAASIEAQGDKMQIGSRRGQMQVDQFTYRTLQNDDSLPADELLRTLPAEDMLNRMLTLGLIQLEPQLTSVRAEMVTA